ncbi:MAG TPA: fused MFS/spermidine synthase [Terracidiphilus sp.]|nr:fused MFS/spermidine synthase [Terracidiphilus sp.]
MSGSRSLFGGAIFLGSFLLFLVEPIAAKQLLPALGGSAAVWITCLVFFQTALLVAYLYAHWLAHRSHWQVHCALLLLATASAVVWSIQSIGLSSAHPVASIFSALSISIGLPFLMLGATSPLLQVWLARIQSSGIPWRLYALSNLASLLALALYPTLIEPHFTLHAQRLLWCCGFAAFALVSAVLTWRTRTQAQTPSQATGVDESQIHPASRIHKLLWVLLPMGAAMQLSAVTSYITANIAAIPLLWILPLAVYLITLILAFQFPQFLPRGIVTRFLVVMLAGLAYMLSQTDVTLPIRVGIAFFLVEVFISCLFCHSEAYALRPQRSSESTLFYLLFAAGGALGSFLIGIASPLIFSFNYDIVLTFLVTALLALAVNWSGGWPMRLLWSTASILLVALVFMLNTAYRRDTPLASRNFYGSLRVRQSIQYPGAIVRTLTNGTVQHGTQIFSPELSRTPTTYYGKDSGIGIALHQCCEGRARNIGVIGLGAGTIAAYGQPGDRIEFYEINPAVPAIAHNLFTYLRDSAATIDVVEGDARTSMAAESPRNFDVLVVDAFSGDAIPLHLLTSQAVALYRRHLTPGGILAFHISNHHVDLEPEVALLAKAAGMQAMRVSSPANQETGEYSATWMLLTDNAAFFSLPAVSSRVRKPVENPSVHLWTDDYSSLLPLLR